MAKTLSIRNRTNFNKVIFCIFSNNNFHSRCAPGGLSPLLRNFYHIDCYRLKDSKDILELDFKKIIADPKNIIAVEWPEKIKKVLPKNIIKIKFTCPKPSRRVNKNKREIKIDSDF